MLRSCERTFALLGLAAFSLACASESETPDVLLGGESGPTSDVSVNAIDPADPTPIPSEACGQGIAPVQGDLQLQTPDGLMGQYLLTTPPSYSDDTPSPVVFVFHGANNSHIDCRSGGNCTGVSMALERSAVTVYVRSLAAAVPELVSSQQVSWTDQMLDDNVAFFDQLLEHVEQNYCVDRRRVVALGTSSGAHFSNILACRRGDRLAAIVPGAGEAWETEDCQGRVAALVIHGVDDPHVPFNLGEEARDLYAERNGCDPELAGLTEMHSTVRAARDADEGVMECVDYTGCDAGLPVRWCEHSEGGYDDSTHGWPVAGGDAAREFILAL